MLLPLKPIIVAKSGWRYHLFAFNIRIEHRFCCRCCGTLLSECRQYNLNENKQNLSSKNIPTLAAFDAINRRCVFNEETQSVNIIVITL